MTPILHASVLNAIDELRGGGFIESLPGAEEGAGGADLVTQANRALSHALAGRRTQPLMFNEAQSRVAEHFAGFARPSRTLPNAVLATPYGVVQFEKVGALMMSLGEQAASIARRHPRLDSPEALAGFMRSPEFLNVIRTIASGGNGFSDGLLGRNNSPESGPWRDDPSKPYLEFTAGGEIRPAAGLVRAAQLSKQRNREMESLVEAWPEEGILGAGRRHSAGCPVRTLIFSPATDNLHRMGVALTGEQLKQLSQGPNPVISPLGDGRYMVVRDAYRELALLIADSVGAMTRAGVAGHALG
jgi:hypothetical protein